MFAIYGRPFRATSLVSLSSVGKRTSHSRIVKLQHSTTKNTVVHLFGVPLSEYQRLTNGKDESACLYIEAANNPLAKNAYKITSLEAKVKSTEVKLVEATNEINAYRGQVHEIDVKHAILIVFAGTLATVWAFEFGMWLA